MNAAIMETLLHFREDGMCDLTAGRNGNVNKC